MRLAVILMFTTAIVCACSPEQSGSKAPPNEATPAAAEAASPLAGTNWTLVEIQSPDDAIGTVRPDDPAKYTMALGADGKVSMRLNCNRGMGTWKATTAGGNSGGFEFGPLGMTKMLCPPPSLDQQIAKDTAYVRSYVFESNRLHLSLMADGGIYVWEKAAN